MGAAFPLHAEKSTTKKSRRKQKQIQSYLESGGAPVDELDAALALDDGDGGVDVLGDHVAAVEHAAGHVLAVPGERK